MNWKLEKLIWVISLRINLSFLKCNLLSVYRCRWFMMNNKSNFNKKQILCLPSFSLRSFSNWNYKELYRQKGFVWLITACITVSKSPKKSVIQKSDPQFKISEYIHRVLEKKITMIAFCFCTHCYCTVFSISSPLWHIKQKPFCISCKVWIMLWSHE